MRSLLQLDIYSDKPEYDVYPRPDIRPMYTGLSIYRGDSLTIKCICVLKEVSVLMVMRSMGHSLRY